MDPTLEVAIAGQDGRDDEVVRFDRRGDGASSGPELPMHVVQPYPARANPSVRAGP
jgi:hypothetical protein